MVNLAGLRAGRQLGQFIGKNGHALGKVAKGRGLSKAVASELLYSLWNL
jgi:hypothetical protein